VLLKALAKERADRYEDVMQMVEAFKTAWREAGVPMKGTSVTIAKAAVPADATRAKTSEPTKMAAKAQAAVPTPQTKKRRSSVVWVGLVLLLAVCAGGFFVARQNRLFARLLSFGGGPGQVNTPAVVAPTVGPVATKVSATLPPPPSQQALQPTMPAEVAAAQQRVKENPDNPEAQLDLALAFWNTNMTGASYDTLLTVIRLAGPENEAFYTHAGDRFADVEGWLPAAALYFQARKTYGLDGNVPVHLNDSFHEAMYKGAEKSEAAIVLPFDKIAPVDQPIALIAQSRNAFYSGKLDESNTFLNQVKRLSPNMPEAFLLEAEFDSLTDKPNEARIVINGLLADLSTPGWIRVFAEEIIRKLPQ